jgi:hypothetical protein
MAKMTLVHPQEGIEVLYRVLVRKSDLFADNTTLAASPYTLKSQVSIATFREFVAALEGKTVTITIDNFRGLSQLSKEFGFHDLEEQLTQFRESGAVTGEALRLSALEERMDRIEALIEGAALPRSAAETVTAPALAQLEAAVRTLKEEVTTSAAALEERMQQRDQEIAALQAELSRVQELAAKTITAPALTQLQADLEKLKDSTEPLQNDMRSLKESTMVALLGRVSRLEAEISDVKKAPVPAPAPKPAPAPAPAPKPALVPVPAPAPKPAPKPAPPPAPKPPPPPVPSVKVTLSGITWKLESDHVPVGIAANVYEGVEFRLQAYDVDRKVWQYDSDWHPSNWKSWKPQRGTYWLHGTARIAGQAEQCAEVDHWGFVANRDY